MKTQTRASQSDGDVGLDEGEHASTGMNKGGRSGFVDGETPGLSVAARARARCKGKRMVTRRTMDTEP
jgi:hypothetical protein